VANEPVSEILGKAYNYFVDALKEKFYEGKEEAIPKVEYIGGTINTLSESLPKGVKILKELSDQRTTTYEITSERSELPDTNTWLELLSGNNL